MSGICVYQRHRKNKCLSTQLRPRHDPIAPLLPFQPRGTHLSIDETGLSNGELQKSG